MRPSQRNELRRSLERRRETLLEELKRDAARARDERFIELAGTVTDRGDESVADLLADLDEAELTRDLAELRDIEAARAEPAAARCVECQRRHEKTYRR